MFLSLAVPPPPARGNQPGQVPVSSLSFTHRDSRGQRFVLFADPPRQALCGRVLLLVWGPRAACPEVAVAQSQVSAQMEVACAE